MSPKEKRKSAYSLALQQVQKKEQQQSQENSNTVNNSELPQYGETVSNSNTSENSNAVKDSITVENSNTVESSNTANNSKAVKSSNTAKITIYPTQAQVDKLYGLMEAYRRKTGFRINQQDMIRRLIDLASEDTVLP